MVEIAIYLTLRDLPEYVQEQDKYVMLAEEKTVYYGLNFGEDTFAEEIESKWEIGMDLKIKGIYCDKDRCCTIYDSRH